MYTQLASEIPVVTEETQFIVKKALSKHENPVPCPDCGKLMKNERGLKLHFSKMHKQ